MSLTVATWNINSVRLRIGLVVRFLQTFKPDVLCLQETKCPQGQFPEAPLREIGYGHIAERGQSGYHGVAIVARVPVREAASRRFCGKDDCRHISVLAGETLIHNFYVPAGGDEPDPDVNEKFAHKLRFLDELETWTGGKAMRGGRPAVVVGDLNVAPLECDVWSHKELLKVVSHTPVETEGLERIRAAGGWTDVVRQHFPAPEKLYTWWSYRARDWALSNRGRRLDHIWASPGMARTSGRAEIVREARGWPRPSDHVPVIASFGTG